MSMRRIRLQIKLEPYIWLWIAYDYEEKTFYIALPLIAFLFDKAYNDKRIYFFNNLKK